MLLSYLLFAGAVAYLFICICARWREARQALAQISFLPGERIIIGNTSPLGVLLPHMPRITLGRNYSWRTKYQIFERLGTGIHGTVSVFPLASYFTLADPVAVKRVSYSRNNFAKNTAYYTVLEGFGSNLLVVEGEKWKRQRRIAAPAFSDKNNHLVWEAAKGFVEQMVDTWEPTQQMTVDDVSEDLALPLSICVIAKAGMGQDVSWGTDSIPDGHTITFKDALATVSKTLHLPLVLPSWAWGLRTSWSEARRAHTELRLYLQAMINSRRELKEHKIQELIDRKHDLFNQLIYARDADDTLTEDELIGNIFIFLIAGHETTAHTFAIALSLLALYPEVQDKLVRQIKELEQEHGSLTYNHIQLLPYALAVIYETLRLFPMVSIVPKKATADTTITVGFPPNTQIIQVPASTVVHIQSTALHYNPGYWEKPKDFDPERFMDPHWNRDAFIAFSLGPRACIGRRFAETTLVAQVTTLISKYEVRIDESRFKSRYGEPILERRSRLINPEERITLSPAPIPLVFLPRN